MTERYYIAYGSNLSVKQMKYRAPDAEIVGTGVLDGWDLVFRKFATIKESAGHSVPVVIWKISAQDEKNLDQYEGYPKFYWKRELTVQVKSLTGEDLREVQAMVYVMTGKAVKSRSNDACPSEEYFELLKESYDDFGFAKKILYDACKASIMLK